MGTIPLNRCAFVIPAYNPEPGLVPLCSTLLTGGEDRIVIVVDDGSTIDVGRFKELPPGTILLRHDVNRGKGRAIKTAIEHVKRNLPAVEAMVFADGDGQHKVEDIECVAGECLQSGHVTMGVRDFSTAGIPFRSRFGNVLTSWLVRRIFKFAIYDTQTGLRAIPMRLADMMLSLPGERYEYEMRLFGALRKKREPLDQISIETIYIEGNRASHFCPIADSVKIYKGLLSDAAVVLRD